MHKYATGINPIIYTVYPQFSSGLLAEHQGSTFLY